MSARESGLSFVTIKRQTQEGVTVDCPYCGQEHTHAVGGYHTALCGQGVYSALTPHHTED